MPYPSSAPTTLRPDIGGMFAQFDLAADRLGFIGTRVLPFFDVAIQSGPIPILPLKELLRSATTTRSSRSGYARDDFKWEEDNYATTERGFEAEVFDRERAIYREIIDADIIGGQRAVDKVLRGLEIEIAGKLFNTLTFTPVDAASGNWADTDGVVEDDATPIRDIEAVVQSIWDETGLWANGMIVSRKNFRNLRLSSEITAKIESVERSLPGDINITHMQRAFDLPNIFVAGGAKNTANAAKAAEIASIWGDDYIGVGVFPTTNDIAEPCVGRTMHWGEDGSSTLATVEQYREEKLRADIFRARMEIDPKIIYPAAFKLVKVRGIA